MSELSLSTDDGLKLVLSPAGLVSGLQLGSREFVAALPSGFSVRETAATPASVLPNPSFETGASGASFPASWSIVPKSSSAGAWTWVTSPVAVGSHCMRLTISGTTEHRSDDLRSAAFPITPNTPYTLSFQTRSSGVGGSYGLTVYVVEIDASGKELPQHGVNGDKGTTDWATKKLTFTSSPNAVRAYVYANIYSGYGSVWIDDFRLEDPFGGSPPVQFGGTVTLGEGGLFQTDSKSGFTLEARYSRVGPAIRVDATLTGTTGADRAVELSYRLPVNATGWTWDDGLASSRTVAPGAVYQTLNKTYAYYSGGQTFSSLPIATVRNPAGTAAFTLAVPVGRPLMSRLSCSATEGLKIVWDLGLSPDAAKNPSRATVSFWIYTQDPAWGFRAAAAKLYALQPEAFASKAQPFGAWVLCSNPAEIPSWRDFGWGMDEGPQAPAWDAANGVKAFAYIDPIGWFRKFGASSTPPTYSAIVSALDVDAASGTGTADGAPLRTMATAVQRSGSFNAAGQYNVKEDAQFWYGPYNGAYYQVYPVCADPALPAPSYASVMTQYRVDDVFANAANDGRPLAGIFVDDLTAGPSRVENYRRGHWAASEEPLCYSIKTHKPCLIGGQSLSALMKFYSTKLRAQGKALWGSTHAEMAPWFTPYLDIVGGEVQGAEPDEVASLRRFYARGKVWTNLLVATGTPTAAQVTAYLRQGLLYGFFPGCNSGYWSQSALYERDRPQFKKYMPLIKKVASQAWEPLTYAKTNNPAVRLERFGSSSPFLFTALNTAAAAVDYVLTLDGAKLGIPADASVTVKDLVSGAVFAIGRSGSSLTIPDSLPVGEVALYEVTVSGSVTPPPDPVPDPTPVPDPVPTPTNKAPNPSFEEGVTAPLSWSWTNTASAVWTWDLTDQQGSRSMKLTASVLGRSGDLLSDRFAFTPNATVTFAAWIKGENVTGVPLTLYFVEADINGKVLLSSAGVPLQHSVGGVTGTAEWSQKTRTFTTDPRCVRAYLYANFYRSSGTAWLDSISVTLGT